MKTNATRFCYGGVALFLCLVFFSMAARCQPYYGGITACATNQSDFAELTDVTMDSFSSADPNHSLWQTSKTYHGMPYGTYSDSLSYDSNSPPSRTADFTLAESGNSVIDLGACNIYGYVATAPGGGVVGNNNSIGDLDWVYDGTIGIEPGHFETNMTVVFHSETLPAPITASQTHWWPVPTAPGGSTNIGGVTYSLLITNQAANSNFVYYSMNELTQSIFIDASNVVLYLTNGISLNGSGLLMLNSNSDVQIYSSGNILIHYPAGISNVTENAHALSIYDVAGYSDTFSFSGNFGPAFIYAPSTVIELSGGGASSDFVGAIVCYDFSDAGHINFHYDESLSGESLPIAPWITQQPTNQIVELGSNATFSVVAGGPSRAYQWFFSQGLASSAILCATNTSLIITNVQSANAGDYSVVISDAFGSVTSSLASLVVYTNATATLSTAFNPTNGQFQLTVNNIGNVVGMPYIIEASTNLTDWVPIWTNASPFSYKETNSFPDRYYRVVFNP